MGIRGIGEYGNRSIRKISELCKINTLKLQSLLKSYLSLTQYTLFPFYLIPPIPYTPLSPIPFTPISLIPLLPTIPSHTIIFK